ncbi:hypothetical protein B0T20DRAFT_449951 [Sordaria brevicollis]|uniref:Uncharacterized protein n=1 Tax=Sordaria brevicollis TaxID=83679 RepID=A0AAE0UGL6_SORBR|nr:hypothetical protein B0T20DRAFT_449951 [Sordaria brevicollis]
MRSSRRSDAVNKERLGGRLSHVTRLARNLLDESGNEVEVEEDIANEQDVEQYAEDGVEDVVMTDPASPPAGNDDEVAMQGIEWSGGIGSSPPSPGGHWSESQSESTSEEEEEEDDGIIDIEELRNSNLDDIVAQAAREDIPLNELLGAGWYEDRIFVAIDSEPSDEDEDEEGPKPIRPKEEGDTSTILPIHQNKEIKLSEFEMALASFADLTGLSRQLWDALREVLLLIKGNDGETPNMLKRLPPQLSTLRKRMQDRMPMMNMREAKIPVDVLKMPSLPPNLKPEERQKIEILRQRYEANKAVGVAQKAAKAAAKAKGRNSNEARTLARAAERAQARANELNKTTTAVKTGITDEEGVDLSKVVLPAFATPLTFFDPPTLFRNIVASDIGNRAHSGPGHFVDLPREFYESHAWLSSVRTTSGRYAHIILKSSDNDDNEENGPPIFPSDWVFYRCTKLPERCPLACNNVPDSRVHLDAHIGRVYGVGLDRRRRPCTTDSEQMCLQIQEAYRRKSPALQRFLDMGIITPEQQPRELILVDHLTYIPETKAFAHTDVYVDHYSGEDHRNPDSSLNQPAKPRLGRQQSKRPPPKQEAPLPKYNNPNCGFKGPRGTKFCRCCFTSKGAGRRNDPDAQINFDTTTNGRYHFQILEMQQNMATMNDTAAAKYGTQWGIKDPFPALVNLSPSLDIVMSRPYDAAHSEFNGIAQMIHELLCDSILTPTGKAEYAVQLRAWPFPPGWQRLQSPFSHRLSWQMVHYGRWLIIAPAMLLHWLKRERMRAQFYDRVVATGRDPVELIVETLAKMAKSTSTLMGVKLSKQDYHQIDNIVHEARHMYNQLHFMASASIMSVDISSVVGTPDVGNSGSDAETPTGSGDGDGGGSTPSQSQPPGSVRGQKRADKYEKLTVRPNVHVGIHYKDFAKEYSLPVNCSTLTGEDAHRYFKRRVYETNYSNVEKVLLMKVNFQQTARLLLLGSFREDDPELTTAMIDLSRQCPTLFDMVLSHSDRSDLDDQNEGDEDEDQAEDASDLNHLVPCIVNKLRSKKKKALGCHVANEGQRLPLRTTLDDMTARWSRLLRHAYHYDFGAPLGEPSFFENTVIKWAEKFSFTDSASRRRFTFKCGDYIQYVSRSDTPKQYRIGRIDRVFEQDYYTKSHVFILITPIRHTNRRHHILDLNIMEELTDEPVIIGLTAVQPVTLYMVHVDGVGIVWVDWDIYTL